MENFTMTDFNYFDVTIASIVFILGIKGYIQGFVKEAFGLTGLVAGVFLASRYYEDAARLITENIFQIENAALLKLAGFLFILATVWLGTMLLGSVFSKLTHQSGLGFLNRLFGFIAGGGKYFLIFALIVTALSNVTLIKDNIQKYTKNSILYPYLLASGTYLIKLDTSKLMKNVIHTKDNNVTTN
jgi:membrane protein required for colicin V production